MKRLVTLVIAIVLVFSFPVVVNADEVLTTPYDLQSGRENFLITSQGLASICYSYTCDELTDHVTITVTLEKKTLLFFWSDVEEWVITSYDLSATEELVYQLSKSGTYRCTIVYENTNIDGTTETREYQKEVKYDPA